MGLNIIIFVIVAVVVLTFVLFAIISATSFKHSDRRTENAFIQEKVPKLKDCGKCGCNTCDKFVDKVRRKKLSVYKCPYTTIENKKDLSKYFEKSEVVEKDKGAIIRCKGGDKCKNKFDYDGILTCKGLSYVNGGNKECDMACLGCGDCVKICPKDAIFINKRGVAEVDPLRCVGCEACTQICPKHLIEMISSNAKVCAVCSTPNFSKVCEVGCSGCGLCVANCPTGAISVVNGKIEINNQKCNGCLNCVRVCPKHVISRI